ncbi:hypothetical protein ILUMI_12334 [Ignelater luminosus]|uniref:TIL domain-containing protein n=1 Tax=Ignelater luminosus TaxID=2038154 RepID=A0A8K0CYM4_IGNLU|nr:hypothetical protein ILUMI_12334 [Ignelater luminosus]
MESRINQIAVRLTPTEAVQYCITKKTFIVFDMICLLSAGLGLILIYVQASSTPPISCTKPYETYACGSACQNECATLGEPCPIVNFRCNDDCYCISGYARDCNGRCIPEEDCSPKK